eukprot:148294-Rhodomonas_salina.2
MRRVSRIRSVAVARRSHLLQESREKVHVLGKDGCVLNAEEASAAQLSIGNVEMKLTAAPGRTMLDVRTIHGQLGGRADTYFV